MRPHGPAFKALRQAQHLSLRALQGATGIDRRYLSRLERAEVNAIEADRADALAGALGVPTAAITDEGDPAVTAVITEAIEIPVAAGDDELTRYSPEDVAGKKWLPWSARKIRELVYARKIYAHTDGGRITFTREDVRRTSALGAIEPFHKPTA
ncbi:helix-turn-helix domain-containing protein [Streptomyces sp. NBC_01324]|uniref:helix-turn-helix transcriptional regulator n=1 Tax=Streptomyces sp. NBC_01324 TaxID=2903826 RepID=UPI002E12B66B|nr:helix-turn-helix domain-containing protein [Streptomyces sp. NBC_01324]